MFPSGTEFFSLVPMPVVSRIFWIHFASCVISPNRVAGYKRRSGTGADSQKYAACRREESRRLRLKLRSWLGIVARLAEIMAKVQKQSKRQRQIMVSTHSPDLLSDESIGGEEVLLLDPQAKGTILRPASSINEVRLLLEGGMSVGDAVLSRTTPRHVEQLMLEI